MGLPLNDLCNCKFCAVTVNWNSPCATVSSVRILTLSHTNACDGADIAAMVPKSLTSGARADGWFDRTDFVCIAKYDQYRCPAAQRAICRFSSAERDNPMSRRTDWSGACPNCPIKSQCMSSDSRRIRRWEHESGA